MRVLDALASASPLDDIFWREHEEWPYCCDLCSANHPMVIERDARQEIDTYLNAHTHTRRVTRDA